MSSMSSINWNVPENPWYAAVTDACVINHLGWNEDDARQTLADLVRWEIQTALDPAVSSEARSLITKGEDNATSRLQLIMQQLAAWTDTLKRVRAECKHDFQPEDPSGKDCGVICIICGVEGHGWYCKTSPTKTCGYNGTDWCMYCGDHKDRK